MIRPVFIAHALGCGSTWCVGRASGNSSALRKGAPAVISRPAGIPRPETRVRSTQPSG